MYHDDTLPYFIWDLLITLGVTLAALDIPLQLVLGQEDHPALVYFDWILTWMFLVDLGLELRRAAGSERNHTTNLWTVVRHAIGWRFVLDLLAVIPFRLLFGNTPLHLLRLAKLARVVSLMRQWRQSQVQKAVFLRLGFFLFWLGLTAHWLACGWLALRGMAPDTPMLTHYVRALYWCVTTLTTVGYGDITPTSNAQMLYTMAVMILGVGVYGYVIGNVASLLANLDRARAHYLENMERLSTFLHYRNVPFRLQRRIYDYYAYLWENRLGYDESAMLAELPFSLRTEVSLALKQEFIHKVPFFQGASQELIRDIALELRPMIFTPGDYVFKAGEMGRQMYFISHGTVEVISTDGTTIYATLADGDFFGEIALLLSQPRTASVRAVDYCDVYALGKDTFERVVMHYPKFARHIQDIAHKRQEQGR